MSQTQDALTTAVLEELGAVGSGQTASAEDTAAVEAKIEPTLADLATRNVIYIPDPNDIDDAAFNHLVPYLAEVCAPKFGRPTSFAAKQAAEDMLRIIARIGRGTGENLKVDRGLGVIGRRRYGSEVLS
jgi:hypothetical protein